MPIKPCVLCGYCCTVALCKCGKQVHGGCLYLSDINEKGERPCKIYESMVMHAADRDGLKIIGLPKDVVTYCNSEHFVGNSGMGDTKI